MNQVTLQKWHDYPLPGAYLAGPKSGHEDANGKVAGNH